MANFDTLDEFILGDRVVFNDDGEIFGQFRKLTVGEDPFNEDKLRVTYFLVIDGKEKKLASSSTRLAKAFKKAQVSPGDEIKIVRIGEGFDTQYQVKVIGTKDLPAEPEKIEVSEEEMPWEEK